MSKYENFDILKSLNGLLKRRLNNNKNEHKKEKYLIIAKNKYFADLFIQENGIDPKKCEYVGRPENLHGLSGWIVCFVPGYWHHPRSMDIEEIAEHLIYQGFLDESEKFNKAYAWSH
jgi:hypothetical protein